MIFIFLKDDVKIRKFYAEDFNSFLIVFKHRLKKLWTFAVAWFMEI
jgi:hypothetical protein